MTDPTAQSRPMHNHKKGYVPLSKLRMSDAVKIISDSPHRLDELLCLLEDRNRRIRDKAAATLAQVVSLNPSRLLRVTPRLREALMDESDYVRWQLVYTTGILIARFPTQLRGMLPDLLICLKDPNRIVQILASKALAQIALRNPEIIEDAFRVEEKNIPPIVAEVLRHTATRSGAQRAESID